MLPTRFYLALQRPFQMGRGSFVLLSQQSLKDGVRAREESKLAVLLFSRLLSRTQKQTAIIVSHMETLRGWLCSRSRGSAPASAWRTRTSHMELLVQQTLAYRQRCEVVAMRLSARYCKTTAACVEIRDADTGEQMLRSYWC